MYLTRRTRRRLKLLLISVGISLACIYLLLPLDSPLRLAVVFNFSRFFNLIRGAATDRDAWLRRPGAYPIDLRNDVGYLIKTGYGTRHRVPDQLDAFASTGDFLGTEGKSFLVVGDWTTVNETDAEVIGVKVHDALRKIIDTKIDKKTGDHPRFLKYMKLQALIESGDEKRANHVGGSFGWELDALKFIMGMEMIYNDLPQKKKWYIVLDDDTFLIRPSLELLLTHLNPKKPQYIGNAVGDYKGRFAHGGSAILISGAAMEQLFKHRDIVAEAYKESLDETWGDRLVATTFQKLGIYIEEAYGHHFNGEPPSITRIWQDRFCSPLVSFHGLRKPGEMINVGRTLAKVDRPVLWSDVWEIFGGQPMSLLAEKPTEQKADHVGKLDEFTRTYVEVNTANECQSKCLADVRCLAWAYEIESLRCYTSPWMILGADGAEGKASGVNWKMAKRLLQQCH